MSLLERLNRKNKKYIAMQQAGQRSKNTHGATGFATSVDEAREASYQAIKSEIHTHIIDEMPDDLQRVINQSSSCVLIHSNCFICRFLRCFLLFSRTIHYIS